MKRSGLQLVEAPSMRFTDRDLDFVEITTDEFLIRGVSIVLFKNVTSLNVSKN